MKYRDIGLFREGIASVSPCTGSNYKQSYSNIYGEEVIPVIYDDADYFENGKTKVKPGKKKFYIDTKGNQVK